MGAAVAFSALVWSLREILLLVFASVLLAVILRFIAEILSARTGMTKSWSLFVGGIVALGLIAAVITLFGAQLVGQFNTLTSQLQSVERTVAGYFDASSVKDLLSGSSLGSLFARALSWGTTAIAVAAGLLLVIVGGVYVAIDPDVYRNGLIKLVPPAWQLRIRATLDDAGEALQMWIGLLGAWRFGRKNCGSRRGTSATALLHVSPRQCTVRSRTDNSFRNGERWVWWGVGVRKLLQTPHLR